jgi:uncharacterized protein (DUF885 family)
MICRLHLAAALLAAGLGLGALAPIAAAARPTAAQAAQWRKLLDVYWEEYLVRNPVKATAIGDDRYNDRFPDTLSAKARAEAKAWTQKWLHLLARVDPARLSGQDRLSYDILRQSLQEDLAGFRFPAHLLPVDQAGSEPVFFAQLGGGQSLQPFVTVQDYERFLRRADGFIAWMDQAILNLREGMAKGVVQPRVVMAKVIPQLDALLVDDPEQSVFWQPVGAMPKAIGTADRERLTAAYRKAIATRIMPAYRRLRDFIRDSYLFACRASVGLSALPDGQAWYAHQVQVMTTTRMNPTVIHELGLKEVARILEEMEAVRRQVGFPGDLQAFFKDLNANPRFYHTSEADLLKNYRALKVKLNGLLPRLFDISPKADYEIRPVEAFRAESAAGGAYQPGTPDGQRPGVFYVNTFNLKAQPIFGMETLLLHEATPGHHFQISIAQEIDGLPKFRRFGGYSAYAEGWALYSESLGKELGLFTDPYQWYGRLSDEQLRALRLVVDTGLHSKGWSREQAIRYMLANSSMAESDIVSEVERYIVWPGQALAYKLGQFAIRDLRAEAERELGSRFDLKSFHRQVLVDGALPLDVLKAKIRAWIAQEKVRQ